MKVINLFGGPGSGKSTTRAGVFNLLKLKAIDVEETTEYAKDLTWEKRFNTLGDSLYVLAGQNHRLHRLETQVEWCVTDSPIIISSAYNEYIDKAIFYNLVMELYGKYENYNFFIKREKVYNPKGRNQTEDEAKAIDDKIRAILTAREIEYTEVVGNKETAQEIISHLGL